MVYMVRAVARDFTEVVHKGISLYRLSFALWGAGRMKKYRDRIRLRFWLS